MGLTVLLWELVLNVILFSTLVSASVVSGGAGVRATVCGRSDKIKIESGKYISTIGRHGLKKIGCLG